MTQRGTNTTNKLKQGNMTINLCRHFCKESDYPYAFLQEGNTCFCDNQTATVLPKVNDANCQKPCSGNNDEVCGDEAAVSIYDGNYSLVFKNCLSQYICFMRPTHRLFEVDTEPGKRLRVFGNPNSFFESEIVKPNTHGLVSKHEHCHNLL